jgi:hypothetical protein
VPIGATGFDEKVTIRKVEIVLRYRRSEGHIVRSKVLHKRPGDGTMNMSVKIHGRFSAVEAV